MSNQGRLTDLDGYESAEAAPFKRKMESVMSELCIPVTLFVACANDIYRKPRPGIWSIVPSQTGNPGYRIDSKMSFIVGDGAGRAKDHSDSDRHFSMNLSIGFFTPEAFFLGQPLEQLGHKFDPEWHLDTSTRAVSEGK